MERGTYFTSLIVSPIRKIQYIVKNVPRNLLSNTQNTYNMSHKKLKTEKPCNK